MSKSIVEEGGIKILAKKKKDIGKRQDIRKRQLRVK